MTTTPSTPAEEPRQHALQAIASLHLFANSVLAPRLSAAQLADLESALSAGHASLRWTVQSAGDGATMTCDLIDAHGDPRRICEYRLTAVESPMH